MKQLPKLFICLGLGGAALATESVSSYDALVAQRIRETLATVDLKSRLAKNEDWADRMALVLLAQGNNRQEANRYVLACCHRDPLTTYVGKARPKTRCEGILRIIRSFREGRMPRDLESPLPEPHQHEEIIIAVMAEDLGFSDRPGSLGTMNSISYEP